DNKSYKYSKPEWGKASPEEREQWERRNTNWEVVKNLFDAQGAVVSVKGMSILQAGTQLYAAAQADPKGWYGNCGEQASIALYLCTCSKCPYKVDPKYLYIINYEKGLFGHSLLVLENRAARGYDADASRDTSRPKAACCDPWMNIACYKD